MGLPEPEPGVPAAGSGIVDGGGSVGVVRLRSSFWADSLFDGSADSCMGVPSFQIGWVGYLTMFPIWESPSWGYQ